MIVREITLADAPEVARLFISLGYEWPTGVIADRISAFVSSGESALVATNAPDAPGGPLLGLATLHITPVLHRTGPVGRVTAMVVDETMRGQGVGRALMRAAEEYLSTRGCILLEVTSNRRRTDAHAFYERIGYPITSFRFAKELPAGG